MRCSWNLLILNLSVSNLLLICNKNVNCSNWHVMSKLLSSLTVKWDLFFFYFLSSAFLKSEIAISNGHFFFFFFKHEQATHKAELLYIKDILFLYFYLFIFRLWLARNSQSFRKLSPLNLSLSSICRASFGLFSGEIIVMIMLSNIFIISSS